MATTLSTTTESVAGTPTADPYAQVLTDTEAGYLDDVRRSCVDGTDTELVDAGEDACYSIYTTSDPVTAGMRLTEEGYTSSGAAAIVVEGVHAFCPEHVWLLP